MSSDLFFFFEKKSEMKKYILSILYLYYIYIKKKKIKNKNIEIIK